jgi:hypothetical protein
VAIEDQQEAPGNGLRAKKPFPEAPEQLLTDDPTTEFFNKIGQKRSVVAVV